MEQGHPGRGLLWAHSHFLPGTAATCRAASSPSHSNPGKRCPDEEKPQITRERPQLAQGHTATLEGFKEFTPVAEETSTGTFQALDESQKRIQGHVGF